MRKIIKKPSLNIIGCGHLGKTLAYLWAKADVLTIGQILNSSYASSRAATEFIGQGQALGAISEMQPANLYLLACPDKALESCCLQLNHANLIKAGDIVFHCSGAISSEILEPLTERGALIASIHPIKSFAEPKQAILSFQPTYCGMEGDLNALAVLKPLFEKIGGLVFSINAEQKTLYHAASVFASNYLVALQSISIRTFLQAGVDANLALKILQPIVQDTVTNIFKLGPVDALTGPIARGDALVVAKQLAALQAALPRESEVYRLLGLEALKLAYEHQKTSSEHLQEVARVLTLPSTDID